MGRVFGTDGVRGVANVDLTPELAFALGRAGAAVVAGRPDRERPIVVGRDTRLSGTMLEAAVVAGITSTGHDTLSLGVVPTPAVARVTVATAAAAGVMISASHNPIEDNGIKFFGPDGFKLTDGQEAAIEALLEDDAAIARARGIDVGIARDAHDLVDHYVAAAIAGGGDLSALTVVVDGAYGAGYFVGPLVLEELGATVEPLHCSDDGSRINVACGSTDLGALARRVLELRAERPGDQILGVAFDGDADRVLFVDETGATVDGDRAMLILARDKKHRGTLRGSAVVGTVMSNIGLERALAAEGIALERAAVGDRYVLEAMRAHGYSFGGEQSGHLIDLDHNTTGDGPAAAAAVLSVVARSGATLHELASALTVAPQILVNVRTADKGVIEREPVRAAIDAAERELGSGGRILVRPSGTEPLVRVMIEGDDRERIDRLAHEVAEIVRRSALT